MHDDGIPGLDDAVFGCYVRHSASDPLFIEDSKPVRAWDNRETAALQVGVIDMQADSHHVVEHAARWLYMVNAILLAPGSPALQLDPPIKRDRPVLVPRYKPVPTIGLVEE